MLRLPIIKLVESISKELTKPKVKTTVLATGTRIHYVDFEKLRNIKKEIEMKNLPRTFPKGR